MKERIQAGELMELKESVPVIDVRTPAEYEQGHIPGAINIPLFDNDERVIVGTLYKKSGKEAAILKGLEITGPKIAGYVKAAKRIAPGRKTLMYCWRGGMRSKSMAWLLNISGFEVSILDGGYKAYRKFIRERLSMNYELIILGGKTGSGKSEILRLLQELGEQVIDLERIANHKGSAFGHIGQEQQPTTEQFENNIYEVWKNFDLSKPVWLEDESRAIGRVSIPEPLFHNMRNSRVIFIDIPKNERIKRLVKEYAAFNPQSLTAAIERIGKRLGGQNVKEAVAAVNRKDFETAASITLSYYDKAYLKGLEKRDMNRVYKLDIETDNPAKNARTVKTFFYEKLNRNNQFPHN